MYTMQMIFKKLLTKIKQLQTVDNAIVEGLYTLSTRSYLVNTLLATLVVLALYSILGITIILWYTVLLALLFFRLYITYRFYTNRTKFKMPTWYKLFIFPSVLTAMIYASLGFYFIYDVEPYYQLFILSVLLGLSSGSAFALSADVRLSVAYMSILLVPLILTLPLLQETPLYIILCIALFVYFMAQITIIYKIHAQKKTIDTLEHKQSQFHHLFRNAPVGIFTYDQNLHVTDCNKALGDLFNHELESIIGLNLNDLPDSGPINTLKESLLHGSQSYVGSYVSRADVPYWVEAKSFSFSDERHHTIGGICMIEDKTKEHQAVEELEYLVEHDALTGLLNRRGFTNHIEALVKSEEHKTYYSILLYLDLNHFKGINDSLGHAVGDEILLSVSRRISNSLDEKCMVSRLGGDEFIVIMPFVAQNEIMANTEAKKCSDTLKHAFMEPFVVKDMQLHIQASMGIVLIEPKYENTEEILRHADLSMYQAKKVHNHIAYYDQSLDERQKDIFMLQHNLAYAVQNKELELFFQPIVKMKDETLRGAELLVRWNHPTRGILSPEEFIPLAIKAGLISKITWWLIESVFKQISQWKNAGQWKLEYVSININSQQLLENNFPKSFFRMLKQYDLLTSEVMIEITERSLIDNFSSTQGVINVLKSHGIKCAIDDFGTGYSSLSYLKRLSFHTLKIDRAFVQDIGQNPKELILMNTILDIGRQFDYNIVIEGIENEQQKQLLLELDSELNYQGYFFSKPVQADEFTKKFMA